MSHSVRNYDHLKKGLEGFSEKQITQHLGLYAGYVNKLNEIEQKLATAERGAANYSYNDYSELKRREAVAFNGTFLHEAYFDNLGAKPLDKSGPAANAIAKAFGSVADWEKDTRAAAASTPGWVVLTHNRVDGKLHNYIMYEHHIGLPVHQTIILALDCWEHAFMIDFGTAKAEYLGAFLKNVNWAVVEQRLGAALKIPALPSA